MNEIVFEKSDKVQVFVDDRELKSSVASALKEKGAVVTPLRLDVGDYVLSERVCVERKNAADFEASVIDGRLFKQAQELRENFASPLIALVGSEFERINPNALRGAFISLAVDYRIPLFFFDFDKELADFLYALGEREQLLEPRAAKLRFGKKPLTLEEQQRFIVESIPLVGPKVALALLQHFKSVTGIVNASVDELQEAEGIGKKRAEEIRRVVSSKYEE